MKIHDLKPAEGSRKRRKRVGRGIAGRGGKTAGRESTNCLNFYTIITTHSTN